MLGTLREEKIIELLSQHDEISVTDLSGVLNVTGKTIRQDLNKLESKGLLSRTHGGATLVNKGYVGLFSQTSTNSKSLLEKQQVARRAIEFIEVGDIIALDGGSTTHEIAKLLANIPMTVITNDLYIISTLIFKDQIKLVVPGGHRYHNQLVSEDPNVLYGQLHIQKAFLSTAAIDLEHGLTIFTSMHVAQKRALIESSKLVYCVADHTKFDKSALLTFAKLDEINCIITDTEIEKPLLSKYSRFGVPIKTI